METITCFLTEFGGPKQSPSADSSLQPPGKHSPNIGATGKQKRQALQGWRLQSKQILDRIRKVDCSKPFREPVDTKLYSDYLAVIQRPVDLATIESKLHEQEYVDFEDFCDDLRQIVRNSKLYNRNHTPVFRAFVLVFI